MKKLSTLFFLFGSFLGSVSHAGFLELFAPEALALLLQTQQQPANPLNLELPGFTHTSTSEPSFEFDDFVFQRELETALNVHAQGFEAQIADSANSTVASDAEILAQTMATAAEAWSYWTIRTANAYFESFGPLGHETQIRTSLIEALELAHRAENQAFSGDGDPQEAIDQAQASIAQNVGVIERLIPDLPSTGPSLFTTSSFDQVPSDWQWLINKLKTIGVKIERFGPSGQILAVVRNLFSLVSRANAPEHMVVKRANAVKDAHRLIRSLFPRPKHQPPSPRRENDRIAIMRLLWST